MASIIEYAGSDNKSLHWCVTDIIGKGVASLPPPTLSVPNGGSNGNNGNGNTNINTSVVSVPLKKAAINGAPNYNNNTMWEKANSIIGWYYGFNGKVTKAKLEAWKNNGTKQGVDCSGYVSYVLGVSGGSYQILEASNNLKTTLTLDASTLKEGDVIGLDSGYKGWDAGRQSGIDHVMIVIKNPANNQLYMAESVGGTGVKVRPLTEGVNAYNKYAQRKGFGSTYKEGNVTKTKQFWVGNYRPIN